MQQIFFLPILATIFLVFHSCTSYELKCPEAMHWKQRALGKCSQSNETEKYYCLHDNLYGIYTEGCTGPDVDRAGQKRVISGSFTRGKCSIKRYQPFDFWTNGSSDCVYTKSLCSEEGQVTSNHGLGDNDRTCRCDYTRGYYYIQSPKDLCDCRPTMEDCTCVQGNFHNLHDVGIGVKCSKINVEDHIDNQDILPKLVEDIQNNIQFSTYRRDEIICVTFLVISMLIAIKLYIFCIHYSENSVTTEPIGGLQVNSIKEEISENSVTTEPIGGLQVNSIKEKISETAIANGEFISDDEMNHLRIFSLLFCVACPVVRLVYNDKMKSTRQTSDRNSSPSSGKLDREMLFIYHPKNLNTNPSDSMDIKLMISLLKDFKMICYENQLPPQSDTRTDALLSRIEFFRSVIEDDVDGRLVDFKFQNYWNEIGQTILRLASRHLDEISRKGTLKDHLLALSPIKEEDIRLQQYVLFTERCPQLILQQLIREYLIDKYDDETIIKLLRDEKHNLFHKSRRQRYCCLCSEKSFSNPIPYALWKKLYKYKRKITLSHTCKRKRECILRYDVNSNFKLEQEYSSALIVLVRNIPRLFRYIVEKMYKKSTVPFFERCKHSIYHAVDKFNDVKCCFCKDESAVQVRKMLTLEEWEKIFTCKNTCVCAVEHCCCLFAVKENVNIDNLDDALLNKIMSFVGVFHVFDKCKTKTLHKFMCWDGKSEEYLDACRELLSAVKDVDFKEQLQIKFSSTCPEFDKGYLGKWILQNVESEESTTGSKTDLVILLQVRGKLVTRNVSVSNNKRIRLYASRITSWTQEETNFIKLNYLLKKVVCPIVRKEFDIHIPYSKLQDMIEEIYQRDLELQQNHPTKERKVSDSETPWLTSFQLNRMFLTKHYSSVTKPDVLDLPLMIRILEENRKAIETLTNDNELYRYLGNIKKIRKMITQSPNGLLENDEFDENWNVLANVVVSLTGESEYRSGLNYLKTQDILKDM